MTPLHADVLRSFSWSTNICGRKRWLFFPPDQEPLLRVCLFYQFFHHSLQVTCTGNTVARVRHAKQLTLTGQVRKEHCERHGRRGPRYVPELRPRPIHRSGTGGRRDDLRALGLVSSSLESGTRRIHSVWQQRYRTTTGRMKEAMNDRGRKKRQKNPERNRKMKRSLAKV